MFFIIYVGFFFLQVLFPYPFCVFWCRASSFYGWSCQRINKSSEVRIYDNPTNIEQAKLYTVFVWAGEGGVCVVVAVLLLLRQNGGCFISVSLKLERLQTNVFIDYL